MTEDIILHSNLDLIFGNLESSLWKCRKCSEPDDLGNLSNRAEGLLNKTKSMIEGMGWAPPKTPELISTSALSAKSVRDEICNIHLERILELCENFKELDELKFRVKELQSDLMDTQLFKI